MSHNRVNFGPLAAEIVSLVWRTPANFNWFRVLAALLHGTLVVGVSQSAALNRGHHICPDCLSMTLVYCGQTVGRIEIKLCIQVGLGADRIVSDVNRMDGWMDG